MHEDGTIHDHADSLCAAHLFYIIVSKSIQSKENFTGPRNLILHIQLVMLFDTLAASMYFWSVSWLTKSTWTSLLSIFRQTVSFPSTLVDTQV